MPLRLGVDGLYNHRRSRKRRAGTGKDPVADAVEHYRQKARNAIVTELLTEYSAALLGYIQTFNRNMVAETLNDLQQKLYNASDSIGDIKLFLADLYLRIKEKMSHLYGQTAISFSSNADVIKFVTSRFYLYEIILYFTEQFENMMSAIGNSSRESVLDDILHLYQPQLRREYHA